MAGQVATIALYSMKGGVGKTTLAVNLAYACATSGRRTLLWDIDGQAAATHLLKPDGARHDAARAVFERDVPPEQVVIPTGIANLDLLPADSSLRSLDLLFAEIDRKKRLRKLIDQLGQRYDRILLDCPPGMGLTIEQVIKGATMILLPMVPSALSRRAFVEVRDHLDAHHKGKPPVFPVFNMVDRRRALHRAALEADPGIPVIPMASAVEQMAERRVPAAVHSPRSPAAEAFALLWRGVEKRISMLG